MPTSIVYNNLLSWAFSMLLLVTSGLKTNWSLARLMWVLILTLSLVPAIRSSAAQAASQKAQAISELMAQTPPSRLNFPADGVYLYGQSPEAGQIGSTYVVFETQGAMMVGALYMPYSSFDCFYGGVESNQLAMTVISSYEQEAYPYSIAILPESTVADASGGASMNSLKLEGLHQIDTLAEMDHQVLEVCRAEYHDQVW